eukprot:4539343-Pleurochrysis_carterae.AAC.5
MDPRACGMLGGVTGGFDGAVRCAQIGACEHGGVTSSTAKQRSISCASDFDSPHGRLGEGRAMPLAEDMVFPPLAPARSAKEKSLRLVSAESVLSCGGGSGS